MCILCEAIQSFLVSDIFISRILKVLSFACLEAGLTVARFLSNMKVMLPKNCRGFGTNLMCVCVRVLSTACWLTLLGRMKPCLSCIELN